MPEIKKPRIDSGTRIFISPLSVNQAWQGRRFKTKAYDQYIHDVLLQLPKREKIMGWVAVEIVFYIKNFGNRDVDNMIKVFLDCLTKKGYFEDDRKVVHISAMKVKSKIEGIDCLIRPVNIIKGRVCDILNL